MQVLWFKRDLRLADHAVLCDAASQGPVMPLYILEPALWCQPDMSQRQYHFLLDCLHSLDQALRLQGHHLVVKVGDALSVLQDLHHAQGIERLWSHQETGNGWTYARDRAVKTWTTAQNIPWYEGLQHGVVRRLQQRDGWSSRWYRQMKQPLLPKPQNVIWTTLASDPIPSADALGLPFDGCCQPQRGGRDQALQRLRSFLYERSEDYTREMSSPTTAFESSSRLSADLAFGTLSIREVFHRVQARQAELKNLPPGERGRWPAAMRSFSARLRWHCHFIQKLEDEPRIEFENLHRAYDALRQGPIEMDRLQAWKAGQTGYPMVDACMRALIATGWMNFRMRAMLMSFASYHLWLHWREPALHLARLFVDYEPGIHYSQAQMQSGTTGINAIRIYNPVKQGMDQDPEGHFIRQWIPELADMPKAYIHQPWQCPSALNAYPAPIVDEKTARKAAAEAIYRLRRQASHRPTAERIVAKHGSRKQPGQTGSTARSRKKAAQHHNAIQGELFP